MVPSSVVSLGDEPDGSAAVEEVLLRAAVVPPVAVAPPPPELPCSAWLEADVEEAVD